MSNWIKLDDERPEKGQLVVFSVEPVKHKREYASLPRTYGVDRWPCVYGNRVIDRWMPLDEVEE